MMMRMCPRCRRLTTAQSGYCPQCQDAAAQDVETARAASNRKYSATKRDKKLEAFYKTPAWRSFSRRMLSERGYRCEGEGCTALAVEVHHVVPIDTPEGWARRFDPTNCKIVCIRCHNFAHKRFGSRPGAATRGVGEKV